MADSISTVGLTHDGGSLAPAGPPIPVAETGGIAEYFDPGAIPFALAVVIGTVVGTRLLQRFLARVAERAGGRRLFIKQIATLASFVAYLLAAVIAATSLFRLSSSALLALSGTLAVVVGFALKDVGASMLAGLSILVNRPFQVGDRISFGGFYGEVIEIGLRSVRLVTLDDNLVTIPAAKFMAEPVASANAGALDCMVVISISLDKTADHARAREVLHDAVLASKYLFLGKPLVTLVSTRLSAHGSTVIELTAKAYVFDARYEKAFASDVTDRVLTALRADGIALA